MVEQSGAKGRGGGGAPPSGCPRGDTAHPRLTRMDVEMLRFMAEELTFTEISQRVGMSKLGIVRRAERLMTLLDVRSRDELVAKVKQNGLI